MNMKLNYRCSSCGQVHDGPPLSYSAYAPALWYTLSEDERDHRALLSSDNCVIDRKYFFIMGNIEIPILDSQDIFIWSVWVSLSKSNYNRAKKLWLKEDRETEVPYFGWLSTQLIVYPDTLNLKTMVHTRPVGQRPWVELEATDHPLSIEQRKGITRDRVIEFAEKILHDG
jgi:hypothetical protein